MENKTILVPADSLSVRLDYFLAQQLTDQFSRTKIKQLIEKGKITLNDKAVKPHTHIEAGDQILISYDEEPEDFTRAENIAIDVLYEDSDIIVVNKPAGMVVHPACGNPSGTLVNALLHHAKTLSSVGGAIRPGLVHRLDKDTSGILVIAKNDSSHRFLAHQFKQHDINRCYWVVVKGVVQHNEMRADYALGKSPLNRKKVIVKPDDGKPSVTNFRVLKRFANATLLEARPETGRTHQIRVHLRSLGYPVLGDLVYGVMSPLIQRQALHAKELGFTHPTTKKKVLFSSEIPPDMKSLLDHLAL